MNPGIVIAAISLAEELLRLHLGKPEGWKPTPEDWTKFIADVDAATVEREKQLAQERLEAGGEAPAVE